MTTPLCLHPDNPHLFLFRGKPTVLITSAEHYGAVINPDFDYVRYLDTLHAEGMNYTRAVLSPHWELPHSTLWRGGYQNPLCPRPGRHLAPWARSDEDGFYHGGPKFDLDRWDEAYWARLHGFMQAASDRGIVVEFNAFYVQFGLGDDPDARGSWILNPLNAINNVNGVGSCPWNEYNTLKHPDLVARQDALLTRALQELNPYDNVFYEICDEPYWSGASVRETQDWQNHLIETFVQVEQDLPCKHLIAVNVANGYAPAAPLNPHVGLLNFHYASPPACVPLNWHLNRAIGFDETSGSGGGNVLDRRREAWAFLLSGGALFNNLDPSFATDDPTGSGQVEQPDGRYNNRLLRRQLRILRDFLNRFDLLRLRPAYNLVQTWVVGASGVYALADEGRAYALYFVGDQPKQTTFTLDLPPGTYEADWTDPQTGTVTPADTVEHAGGSITLTTPRFAEDIALRLAVRNA